MPIVENEKKKKTEILSCELIWLGLNTVLLPKPNAERMT